MLSQEMYSAFGLCSCSWILTEVPLCLNCMCIGSGEVEPRNGTALCFNLWLVFLEWISP